MAERAWRVIELLAFGTVRRRAGARLASAGWSAGVYFRSRSAADRRRGARYPTGRAVAAEPEPQGLGGGFVDTEGFGLVRVAREDDAVERAGASGRDVALHRVVEDGMGRALMGVAVAAAPGGDGDDLLAALEPLLAHEVGKDADVAPGRAKLGAGTEGRTAGADAAGRG